MLIRGQTTEDRIKEIAQGFSQGLQGYAQYANQEAKGLREEEARKRQEALQALEVSNKIADQTGKYIDPGQVAPLIKSGSLSGIGELLKTAPATRKAELEAQKSLLDNQYKQSQINANNRKVSDPNQNLTYEQKLDLKIRKEQEAKAVEKKDPSYNLEKLGADGRSKVGALASGLQALDQMEKASSDGFGPEYINANTSLIGGLVSDTPYSEGERITSEVIGRLQSGGAIQADEIKTFRALGPRPGDDAPTRKRKLAQQKDFLQNKLTAFGIDDNDLSSLGFKTISDYQPRNTVTQGVTTKQAAPVQVSPDQVKAVKSMSDEELLRFVQGG
jgi:hypothetical protein